MLYIWKTKVGFFLKQNLFVFLNKVCFLLSWNLNKILF